MDVQNVVRGSHKSGKHKPTIALGLGFVALLFAGIVLFILTSRSPYSQKVVATVGNERIYQSDIEYELQYFDTPLENKEEIILTKIAQDSMILQEAEKLKLVILHDGIYNSASKNYKERLASVESIKMQYDEVNSNLSGYVFTFWFLNNNRPGTLGYEAGKAEALKRITSVRDRIVAKEDPSAVLSELAIDTSLTEIDPAYANNMGFPFSVQNDKGPLFDTSFNKEIWKLAPGEVSKIMVINDNKNPNNTPQEALYAFALITDKLNNGLSLSYNEWVESLPAYYEIVRN